MADIPAVAMAYRLAEDQNALLKRVRQAKALRERQAHGAPVAPRGDAEQIGDVARSASAGAASHP